MLMPKLIFLWLCRAEFHNSRSMLNAYRPNSTTLNTRKHTLSFFRALIPTPDDAFVPPHLISFEHFCTLNLPINHPTIVWTLGLKCSILIKIVIILIQSTQLTRPFLEARGYRTVDAVSRILFHNRLRRSIVSILRLSWFFSLTKIFSIFCITYCIYFLLFYFV
jgi:hypothetical protein